MNQPQTISELQQSGCQTVSVKDELRRNLIEKMKKGDELFPGIIGYDDSVIPEIENAILSGHNIIFLGERGQAKTRIMRKFVALLDEYIPIIAGCEINDNPFGPVCRQCQNSVKEHRGNTRIEWIQRSMRYAEKLATPDVNIADLIGDIDPIKIAEGRYLSDELAIHYGLIPRANRGILSINELPDLHEKIQVGLFNLLEEQDVQIRGYKISLPLDIVILATANPEDYTSRGRIITPLKDRFGAQIRTHYPRTIEEEIAIVRQERMPFTCEGFTLQLPLFMEEIIAELSQTARRKSDINQHSGISVRMTIHNMENLISNALRRAIRLKEPRVVPRIADLAHLCSSMKGKIEWDFLEDGGEEDKIAALLKDAIAKIFRKQFAQESFAGFLKEFATGEGWEASEMTPAAAYMHRAQHYPSLQKHLDALFQERSPELISAGAEFILEGLSQLGRIKKDVRDDAIHYSKPA
jgi:magnesium chelatase subunit I